MTSRERGLRAADSRGVSVVVGTALVTLLAVSAAVVIQVSVVPAENKQAEFEHDKQVRQDLVDLTNTMSDVGVAGVAKGEADIHMAPEYKDRTLFINPPNERGTLTTASGTNTASVAGAVAINSGAKEYWDGTARSYQSKVLSYNVEYNSLNSDPTYYVENGGVIAKHDGEAQVINRPEVLDGTEIDLRTVQGDADMLSKGVETVGLTGVAKAAKPTVVSNPGGTITITTPTTLPESYWQENLQSPHIVSGPTVNTGSGEVNELRFELDGDQRYSLYIPKVQIGQTAPEQSIAHMKVEQQNVSLGTGDEQSLTVTAYDRHGYPVNNVDVAATVNGEGEIEAANRVTDGSGAAEFVYTAPESPSTQVVRDQISFTVAADDAVGGGATVASTSTATVTAGDISRPRKVQWKYPDQIPDPNAFCRTYSGYTCYGYPRHIDCDQSRDVCTVNLDRSNTVPMKAILANGGEQGSFRVDYRVNQSGAMFSPSWTAIEQEEIFADPTNDLTTLKIWEPGTYVVSADGGQGGDSLTLIATGDPEPVVTRASAYQETEYQKGAEKARGDRYYDTPLAATDGKAYIYYRIRGDKSGADARTLFWADQSIVRSPYNDCEDDLATTGPGYDEVHTGIKENRVRYNLQPWKSSVCSAVYQFNLQLYSVDWRDGAPFGSANIKTRGDSLGVIWRTTHSVVFGSDEHRFRASIADPQRQDFIGPQQRSCTWRSPFMNAYDYGRDETVCDG